MFDFYKGAKFYQWAVKFSIKNLIEKLKTPINKVAIELNEEIVDKKKLSQIYLKNKDRIEIVHFIGGG